MEQVSKLKSFWEKNQKWLKIVIAVVLALCFVGSIILSVFIGGEFKPVEEDLSVKGTMKIVEADYLTNYVDGDTFVFDKDKTTISLIVKDPDTGKINQTGKLDNDLYGFRVNGEGDIIDEASSIKMTTDVTKISVVSKEYPTLKMVDIPVTVVSLANAQYSSTLTLEAENAKIYESGKLLTGEEMTSKPNAEKPYISSEGTSPAAGVDCSGDACIRSLGTNDVTISFEVVCKEEATVKLKILICKRPKDQTFGQSFELRVNNQVVDSADNINVPADSNAGYFVSYEMQEIEITLNKGVNVISFVNKKNNPGNLDAIILTANGEIIAKA